MESKENIFSRRALALGLIVLNWVLCAYLSFRSTQLKGEKVNIPDLCKTVFGSTCDRALSTTISWQLGYPLTGWGLTYFGLLGVLFSLRKPLADWVVLFVAAFGVGVSAFQSNLILTAGVSCPVCLTIHFVNLVTLVVLFFGVRTLVAKRSELLRWAGLLLLTILVGGFSEYNILKFTLDKKAQVNLDEVARKFQEAPVYNIPPAGASPAIGRPDAPVQVVVFSSFQCPACKTFAPSLENIHRKFGDKVSITFKNFPLSSACNPRLAGDMQPRSCNAAIAAIAAERQNLFWQYHDQLFQSNLEFDDTSFLSFAKNIGVDLEKWKSDFRSTEVEQRLLDDIQLANEIGINSTPTVFINGRRASNFQETALVFLIQYELNKL